MVIEDALRDSSSESAVKIRDCISKRRRREKNKRSIKKILRREGIEREIRMKVEGITRKGKKRFRRKEEDC